MWLVCIFFKEGPPVHHLAAVRRAAVLRILILVCALAACRSAAAPHAELGYIEDDYALALETARSTQRPLLVDVWASWCPGCRKMSDLLAAPEIAALRDSFVWLSVDADRTKNEAFLKRYQHRGLPTVWVIDGASGTVVSELTSSSVGPHALQRLLVASAEVAHGDTWDRASLDARWDAALHRSPARTPEERKVDVTILVGVYRRAGRLDDAIALVTELETDFPKNYLIPLEHARLCLDAGRADEAATAVERARTLPEADGSLGLLITVADVAKKRGDQSGERAAVRAALELVDAYPYAREQDAARDRAALRARLAQLDAGSH